MPNMRQLVKPWMVGSPIKVATIGDSHCSLILMSSLRWHGALRRIVFFVEKVNTNETLMNVVACNLRGSWRCQRYTIFNVAPVHVQLKEAYQRRATVVKNVNNVILITLVCTTELTQLAGKRRDNDCNHVSHMGRIDRSATERLNGLQTVFTNFVCLPRRITTYKGF